MKRSILFLLLSSALLPAQTFNHWGPDNPELYHAPEPAAVAEIAAIGVGLGFAAWRRSRKSR